MAADSTDKNTVASFLGLGAQGEDCTVLVGSSAMKVGLPAVAKFSLELWRLQTSSQMMGDAWRGWPNRIDQLLYASGYCASAARVSGVNTKTVVMMCRSPISFAVQVQQQPICRQPGRSTGWVPGCTSLQIKLEHVQLEPGNGKEIQKFRKYHWWVVHLGASFSIFKLVMVQDSADQ